MSVDNYTFDDEELCYKDEEGDTVYCSSGGCEAPAANLVGEDGLPLCSVCADVWHMGYNIGYDDGYDDGLATEKAKKL